EVVGRIHVRQHCFFKTRQFVFPSGILFFLLLKYDKLHNLSARLQIFSVKSILGCQRIVRNRLKIAAAIENAKMFLDVRKEFRTFDAYLWRFVGAKPIQNRWRSMAEVPARTAESDAMSHDLVRRGFKFVGSTICYALMQATGMVNDHLVTCQRYAELGGV